MVSWSLILRLFLEHLQRIGIKNGLSGILRGVSLEELGRTIIAVRNSASLDPDTDYQSAKNFALLIKEIQPLITTLSTLDEVTLYGPLGDETISNLFELATHLCGPDGCAFLLGLFVSSIGEGAFSFDATKSLSIEQRKAVIHYLTQHPELYAPTV